MIKTQNYYPLSSTKIPQKSEKKLPAYAFNDILARPIPLWKRASDIMLASLGIILTSPFWLFCTILIKTASRGPLFFTQERVGRGGRLFKIYKFRTMRPDGGEDSHRKYIKQLMETDTKSEKLDTSSDNRIIPFGKLIRAAGIDELPQLLNVLKGEMSLIGPRPCIQYEYEMYATWQKRRLEVLPGLTGLWQVNGKNRTTIKQMMRYDLQYVERFSFLLDVWIVVKTPFAIAVQVYDTFIASKKEAAQ